MKYLISLKHTNKTDAFFTLWRPDNKGYCQSLNMAGLYDELEKAYHTSDDTLPVDSDILERMGSTVNYDGELKTFVPQNRYTLAELGLKRTPKGLIKNNDHD
jgi:hypothetical protein